jgi:hypothetical protein
MESTYRTWIHAKKETSNMWNSEELRRDLQTALGTTKWQVISHLVCARVSVYIEYLFDWDCIHISIVSVY